MADRWVHISELCSAALAGLLLTACAGPQTPSANAAGGNALLARYAGLKRELSEIEKQLASEPWPFPSVADPETAPEALLPRMERAAAELGLQIENVEAIYGRFSRDFLVKPSAGAHSASAVSRESMHFPGIWGLVLLRRARADRDDSCRAPLLRQLRRRAPGRHKGAHARASRHAQ